MLLRSSLSYESPSNLASSEWLLFCSTSISDPRCFICTSLPNRRKGLSASLNLRPTHNNSTSFFSNVRYYTHCFLVLLGLRPSISHILRDYILPKNVRTTHRHALRPIDSKAPESLAAIMQELPTRPTTACYLIFSDGNRSTILEKDHVTAVVRSSESFIAATNHDQDARYEERKLREILEKFNRENLAGPTVPMKYAILLESIDRRDCMKGFWEDVEHSYRRENPEAKEKDMATTERRVAGWMMKWPISNECTHYWCLMDPTIGEVKACVMYVEPLGETSET